MFGFLRNLGLSKYGIVGINRRNVDLILEHNRRKYYPFADSKFKTKQIAQSVGVNVPELFLMLNYPFEIADFHKALEGKGAFVIKPDHGSGGGGIIVIREKARNGFRKASGVVVEFAELRYHMQNILSGMYSLGGRPDSILIEEAVAFDPLFDEIAYQGVPDVRLIVLNGRPLMGMLRLPTKASDGKANLHTGGLGVGVNMDTGVTTYAIQRNRYVTHHPETGYPLRGRAIPFWRDMLDISVKMQQASGLGYVGVDIVIDKRKGPMVLEINARPGIAIQAANCKGLGDCL
ncbi:MAG: alpha-L-glutamate ligase-like protein [Rickettsiales bacterium]